MDRADLARSTLTICATLAAGFALLSAVTWLGFKEVASVASRPAAALLASASPPAPVAAAATGGDARPPSQPAHSELDDELRVRDDLAMALAAQKPIYLKACFQAGRDRPRGYSLELQVDAAGNELSRKLTPAPGKPQPELDACMTKVTTPALKVSPPGKAVTGHLDMIVP